MLCLRDSYTVNVVEVEYTLRRPFIGARPLCSKRSCIAQKSDFACLSLAFEEGDNLGAVVGVAFAVDVAQVRLDGGLADKERVLDVLEAVARHPEGKDVGLAFGEPVVRSKIGDGVFG